MPEKELKVELIQRTENAVEVVYAACRQCYSPGSAYQMYSKAVKGEKRSDIEAFIRKIIASGHESPLEHVSFTFAIEGVSRALTHQLVRHRLASYSQQSQRYVKAGDMPYIVPPSVASDPEARRLFIRTMEDLQKSYDRLLELLGKRSIKGEKANQDARFVLPQAAETKIVVTMNARELKHFFALRCCARAQWEIRNMADRMLDICKCEVPVIFESQGAKCVTLGYCPEGPKFSCGRYPLLEKGR